MEQLIGLDFETYAEVDLTKHGLDRYISCPHFRPLRAAVAFEDGREIWFDFVDDYTENRLGLIEVIGNNTIVAHNAGFEQAVLAWMGVVMPSDRFIDSAVLARAAGAAGKLEAAAPQLLGMDKLESGWNLIKLFSIPGKYQEESGNGAFDPQIVKDNPDEWTEFGRYCGIDAVLGLKLALLLLPRTSEQELANNAVTMDMNKIGWNVDMDMVREMQRRYLENVDIAVQNFRFDTGAADLNLNSTPQLREWCAERGIKATSFDEAHVERLLKSINKRMAGAVMPNDKYVGYLEVKQLLEAKQIMGGSSLKKLQTIIDTVGTDGRLHDQYLHCGAGASYRTTGRGVQMQNLKRLNGEGDDMLELYTPVGWDNQKLASNLRQVFTATDPDGFLIVGDFSSVESRGLAWQAGEQWKIDAYFAGKDLYKVQAGKIYGKHEAHVTKAERQVGKVGELACGYGAGKDAVRDFAAKMGVVLTEIESAKLVQDWRAANPQIVEYWRLLDQALHDAVILGQTGYAAMKHGWVKVIPMPAPQSLRDQTGNPNLVSLMIRMYVGKDLVVDRVIHGTYVKGRNIQLWKPSERKTGDLWVDTWMNPKTKQQQPFTVYGGKLSGLLTQSLCREMFFTSLRKTAGWVNSTPSIELVGQFHDEIVLDWAPDPTGPSLDQAKDMLNSSMSATNLPGFPLAAEIKHDHRYTK
jgi:DNA polymerase